MAEYEFSWPKQGDKLFDVGQGEEKSFHVGSIMWHCGASEYASGFKEAADMVIDCYEAAPRAPYYDRLVFPVAYLYRHVLEVKLKEILHLGMQVGEVNVAKKLLGTHDLSALWKPTKELIVKSNKGTDMTPVEDTESIVKEFHESDKTGQRWRYHTDKYGNPHFRDDLPEHISLTIMKKTMDRVFSFLECIADGLHDWVSNLPRESDYY